MARYDYGAEADRIQELFLAGRKEEATAAVPTELVRDISLIGSEGFVKERIAAFAAAGVTVLNVAPLGRDTAERVRLIEKRRALVDQQRPMASRLLASRVFSDAEQGGGEPFAAVDHVVCGLARFGVPPRDQ